jgi:uncharacterized membrane protein
VLTRIQAAQRLAAALGVAAIAALAQPASLPLAVRTLVAWDVGVITYLGLAWALIARADARQTRAHALAHAEDQSAFIIFLLIVGAACAGIVAIGFLAGPLKDLPFWPRAGRLALSIVALMSSWLLIQTVFALRYASRYYAASRRDAGVPGGLVFPGDREPDYLDFAYYSFVVGMTSQVSDISVASRGMRRLTLIHGVLSFMFNMAILALSINIIAGVI